MPDFRCKSGHSETSGANGRWVGLFPKMLGGFQRIDFESFPPRNLITSLMQLPMVPAAERNGEFIADFKTDGSRLSKPQMMRIGRLPPADKARLRRDEF